MRPLQNLKFSVGFTQLWDLVKLTCLEYSVLDCKGLKATVSILAVLFPLFIAFMYYFVYRRNKKQSNLKIQHLETELAGNERDQRELEENLAHTEQGKFVYQDILFSDN